MLRASRWGTGGGADPMDLLALHVVRQALQDARAGRQDAAAWLRAGAGGIFEVFDVDAGRIEKALNRPKRRRKAKSGTTGTPVR